MAGDRGRKIVLASPEKEIVEEKELVKSFLIRCKVQHVVSGEKDVFLDVVDASNAEDAKDVVAGRLADYDYAVIDWEFVRDADSLRHLVSVVSRR